MTHSFTESDLLQTAGKTVDPVFQQPLSTLRTLKEASIADGRITITVELPLYGYPQKDELTTAIQKTIADAHSDAGEVTVDYTVKVRGKDSGGSIGLKVKNVIAVGSGKGGVGKSTMAASIAYGLKELGASVGLMDADVYGPSIPHMLNVEGQPAASEPSPGVMRIEPNVAEGGVKVMSIGFFVKPDQAVVWRGPMLHKTLTQFLKDVEWGELDYLIIDMPPGTGDVSLTLSQLLGLAGAVIVCTPQQVALLDAVKAISMFNQVRIPVLGIVENMSGDVFGRGGACEKAKEMDVPFLGEMPIDAQVRIQGDAGNMAKLFDEDSSAREPLMNISQQVALGVAKKLLEGGSMPTLEIL
ncbi:Mrp/NBP35 family ATP-binding protein [Thalassoroseus pseudoceratinae]|uniref:Mrp/NBP35 family ATP-binding protein n=1 Tax=Thalassoroseus pseudoceratinae TaxID=2713176 RepID=UPI001423C092|nr:Mrp/NBP35 family ATP-binding protein [Thalassoroseus pseudoceratinae]